MNVPPGASKDLKFKLLWDLVVSEALSRLEADLEPWRLIELEFARNEWPGILFDKDLLHFGAHYPVCGSFRGRHFRLITSCTTTHVCPIHNFLLCKQWVCGNHPCDHCVACSYSKCCSVCLVLFNCLVRLRLVAAGEPVTGAPSRRRLGRGGPLRWPSGLSQRRQLGAAGRPAG